MYFAPRCKAQVSVVFDGHGAKNSAPLLIEVQPMDCTVSRNGYHEADTWHMTFDARLVPILDPDSIAAIGVNIYMWDDFTSDGGEWAIDANRMINGLADEPEFEIADHGNMYTLRGRDYQGVLDTEWDPEQKVPPGGPIDKVIQKIVDDFAPERSDARFLVIWKGSAPPPNAFDTARSTKQNGAWVKPGKTVWEVIYDLCVSHGFICFVDGATIVISDAKAQTSQSLALAPRFTHGKDLKKLHVHRKLAKERVPQMKAVYWDAKLRQKFEVLYPEKLRKHREIDIGIGIKKNEVQPVPLPPYCHTRDSALRYLQNRWELLARGETTYTFSTRAMTVSVSGDTISTHTTPSGETFEDIQHGQDRDFNLLQLKAGDPIGVIFDPFNQEAMRTLTIGQRQDHIRRMGYSEKVAEFVAQNLERIDQFRQPYYCRKAEYTWSTRDGLVIEVEGVNFANELRELQWAAGEGPDILTPDEQDSITIDPAPTADESHIDMGIE